MSRKVVADSVGHREVRQAFRDLERLLRQARETANGSGAALLARGRYEKADRCVKEAKSLDGLRLGLARLVSEWMRQRRGDAPADGGRPARTALWEVYVPILRALVDRGGAASADELLKSLASGPYMTWKPGDMAADRKGRPKWNRLLLHARKPMLKEGWIAIDKRRIWTITEAGRSAATAATGSTMASQS